MSQENNTEEPSLLSESHEVNKTDYPLLLTDLLRLQQQKGFFTKVDIKNLIESYDDTFRDSMIEYLIRENYLQKDATYTGSGIRYQLTELGSSTAKKAVSKFNQFERIQRIIKDLKP